MHKSWTTYKQKTILKRNKKGDVTVLNNIISSKHGSHSLLRVNVGVGGWLIVVVTIHE
jgi:hypothetical protein